MGLANNHPTPVDRALSPYSKDANVFLGFLVGPGLISMPMLELAPEAASSNRPCWRPDVLREFIGIR
jgi:hypothetical protein